MIKLLLTLLTLGISFYSVDSSAQIFRLRVSNYGVDENSPLFEQFKSFVDTEIAKIEKDINKDLPSGQPHRLMEGMANSSVMAGKGIGSDYASNMSVFLIGGGVGAGADLAKDETTDSDLSGIGIAPGLIIGTNLGFMDTARILGMDTNRLNVYLNFMGHKHKQKLDDKPGKESSAELDMTAMGVHFRYDWIQPRGSKLLGWGGVKFHLGYEYNKTDITFNSKINENVSQTDANGNVISGDIEGSPTAKILVNTHSIPFEISTDVQLLYVLSLYGGLGIDYNFGQAKGAGSLNAGTSSVGCSNPAPNQICSDGTAVEVTPEANIDATGKVNPFTYRGFAGVQLNLPYLRIFGQVDKSLGDDLIGATAGVRFVF